MYGRAAITQRLVALKNTCGAGLVCTCSRPSHKVSATATDLGKRWTCTSSDASRCDRPLVPAHEQPSNHPSFTVSQFFALPLPLCLATFEWLTLLCDLQWHSFLERRPLVFLRPCACPCVSVRVPVSRRSLLLLLLFVLLIAALLGVRLRHQLSLH